MAEDEPYESSTEEKPEESRRRSVWLVGGLIAALAIVLGVILLAKLIGTPDRELGPGELDTPMPTPTPSVTSTPLPTPTITPTPPGSTPVAVEPAAGWAFEGVRVQPDLGLGDLLIYGEAINNSGAPQRILGLHATLYDSQGQALDVEVTDDYWPIETVPPEWRMPFELTVIGPNEADRVELEITTEAGDPPRTDFEVTEVEGVESGPESCVTGRARNLGQPLDSYLMVVAVLYDGDDRVINWGIGYQPASPDLAGDESVVVSACAERYNHNVARYELRAWGE